jgi:hypothetical protein
MKNLLNLMGMLILFILANTPLIIIGLIIWGVIQSVRDKKVPARQSEQWPDRHLYYPHQESRALQVCKCEGIVFLFFIVIGLISIYLFQYHIIFLLPGFGSIVYGFIQIGKTITRYSKVESVTVDLKGLTIRQRSGLTEFYAYQDYQESPDGGNRKSFIFKNNDGKKTSLRLNYLSPEDRDAIAFDLQSLQMTGKLPDSVMQNTVIQNSVVQNTAMQNSVMQNSVVQNSVMQNTVAANPVQSLGVPEQVSTPMFVPILPQNIVQPDEEVRTQEAADAIDTTPAPQVSWTLRVTDDEQAVTEERHLESELDRALTEVSMGREEFLVLAPSTTVSGVEFLQITRDTNGIFLHMEAGLPEKDAQGHTKIVCKDRMMSRDALELCLAYFRGEKVSLAGWYEL